MSDDSEGDTFPCTCEADGDSQDYHDGKSGKPCVRPRVQTLTIPVEEVLALPEHLPGDIRRLLDTMRDAGIITVTLDGE